MTVSYYHCISFVDVVLRQGLTTLELIIILSLPLGTGQLCATGPTPYYYSIFIYQLPQNLLMNICFIYLSAS